MKRHVPWGKRQKARAQDDAVFCAETGALISGALLSSAPPTNVVPFQRVLMNSVAIEREIDKPQTVDNDDI
jgi:hypothetical protein